MEPTYTITYNNGKNTIANMTIEEVHNFINGAMHHNKDVGEIQLIMENRFK